MCGIVGAIALQGNALTVDNIKSMCDVISHRGPDGSGFLFAQTGIKHARNSQYLQVFTERMFAHDYPFLPSIDEVQSQDYIKAHVWDLFFGHRRLAIIDVSPSGFQPISDISKKIWATYNGEIYNYRELRAELETLGYEFYSTTDTEVLINAYIEWGIECIYKLNGMFAFSLWDSRMDKVYLVRDRYGVKPLYYTITSAKQLIFASEIKALLQYADCKNILDLEGLIEYFTFQNFFTDKTLFKGISLLSAGSYIELDLATQSFDSIREIQYWDYAFKQDATLKDERECVEELKRLFEQAVERQLVSDVEVGSYLSGGIDSGSITAIAASKLPYMKTFTVGFDLNHVSELESGFDERQKSELLSYRYKTEHYEMVLKSGDMERCLPNFAWHLEEPRVGQSYPNYYASKLAGKFVKVVLSGVGGDELFGGYPWRYYRAVINNDFAQHIDKYYQFWQRLVPNSELQQIFSPIWDQISHVWTRDIFESVFKRHNKQLHSPEDYVNHSLYFEAKTFLHGLLVVEDKLSMAHSLETRVPFLDNDLVDFAQRIPVHMKLGNLQEIVKINENELSDKVQKYFQKTNDGKLILRKALSSYMPNEYTKGVKQGFSSPDQSWFKRQSEEFVKTALLNKQSNIYQFFDYNSVSKKLEAHFSSQGNFRLFIWSLLNFNSFLKIYF